MTYNPNAKMRKWLAAMEAQPTRIWSAQDAAAVMGIDVKRVPGYATYAVARGVIFQRRTGRRTHYAIQQLPGFLPKPTGLPVGRYKPRTVPKWEPGEDIRVPRVVADWKPPVMVPPRQA